MKKKLIFAMIAILLLTPWPVAYAYENDAFSQEAVSINAAAASAAPNYTVYGRAIGGVNAGDLFYIDTTNSPADISLTLFITNADELVHYYRYMTMKVGVYVQTGVDQWQEAAMGNGEPIPDTYITMQNGNVNFTLPGYNQYKITIDRGCFYSLSAAGGEGSLAPQFYITTE